MKPIERFKINIQSAEIYLTSYKELKNYNDITARKLGNTYSHLLWLPRASIVMSMSALDAYIHDILEEYLSAALNSENIAINPKLRKLILERVINCKVKNENNDDVNKNEDTNKIEIIKLLKKPNPMNEISSHIINNMFNFEPYQSPHAIILGYEYLGISNIFQIVSNKLKAKATSKDDIIKKLNIYHDRRNKIAHSGDLTKNNKLNKISEQYAGNCIKFITKFVQALDETIKEKYAKIK